MRSLSGFICVWALGLMPLVGCSETAGAGGSGGSPDCYGCSFSRPECECTRPLVDYCAYSACGTYDQAVAAVEASADCEDFFWFGTIGRCGDYRYVSTWTGDIETKYFDSSGALVAVHVCTDYCGFCDASSPCVRYGPVPECEQELERDLCENPPPQ